MSSRTKILIFSGALILVLSAVTTNIWIKKEIKSQLKLVQGLEYTSFEINILTGHLGVKDIAGNLNTSHFLSAEAITVDGFNLLQYLFKKRIVVNDVTIERPVFRFNRIEAKDTPAGNTPTQMSRPPIPVRIDSLKINEGSLILANDSEVKTGSLKAHFNFNSGKLSFGSKKDVVFDTFKLTLDSLHYSSPDSIYLLLVKHLEIDENGRLIIDSVRFRSIYGRQEQSSRVGMEKDWIEISIPEVQLSGLEANKVVNKNLFLADKLIIHHANGVIYRDKNLPSPQNVDKLLPHQVLEELRTKFSIDTIQLKSANVIYEELAEGAPQAGKISFNNLYATLFNLTNIDSIQSSNGHVARMDARSKVMGNGVLQASFTFPLASGRSYGIKGQMGEMDLDLFNSMLVHTAFLRIDDGRQVKLDFDFTYDENHAEGEMNFHYEGLKISSINKSGNPKGRSAIKSFIANTFIENKNLPDEKDYRLGRISFERDKQKSIFNYWWKSLLSGFKSSTGIQEKKE